MDYLLANIIDRLEEYHKKANIPIDITVSGITTLVSEPQPLNA